MTKYRYWLYHLQTPDEWEEVLYKKTKGNKEAQALEPEFNMCLRNLAETAWYHNHIDQEFDADEFNRYLDSCYLYSYIELIDERRYKENANEYNTP